MRTGCYVMKSEVLAVVLEDVAAELTFSPTEIKEAVVQTGYGSFQKVSKDFLRPNSSSSVIIRGRTDRKRKCCAIILNLLPNELQIAIKNGIINYSSVCRIIFIVH